MFISPYYTYPYAYPSQVPAYPWPNYVDWRYYPMAQRNQLPPFQRPPQTQQQINSYYQSQRPRKPSYPDNVIQPSKSQPQSETQDFASPPVENSELKENLWLLGGIGVLLGALGLYKYIKNPKNKLKTDNTEPLDSTSQTNARQSRATNNDTANNTKRHHRRKNSKLTVEEEMHQQSKAFLEKFTYPDEEFRFQLFQVYFRDLLGRPLPFSFDELQGFGKAIDGVTPKEIQKICNDAAAYAQKTKRKISVSIVMEQIKAFREITETRKERILKSNFENKLALLESIEHPNDEQRKDLFKIYFETYCKPQIQLTEAEYNIISSEAKGIYPAAIKNICLRVCRQSRSSNLPIRFDLVIENIDEWKKEREILEGK